jgi:hypothetical protein
MPIFYLRMLIGICSITLRGMHMSGWIYVRQLVNMNVTTAAMT